MWTTTTTFTWPRSFSSSPDSQISEVYARDRINGVWGNLTRLTPPGELYYKQVRVACSADGKAYAAWKTSNENRSSFGVAAWTNAGTGWHTQTLDLYTQLATGDLSLATDNDGNLWLATGIPGVSAQYDRPETAGGVQFKGGDAADPQGQPGR